MTLAAVYLVLSRYARQRDICVATPVARRDGAADAEMIGYCVNLLPLRIDVSEDSTLAELLLAIRDVCGAAYEHPNTPLHVLTREAALPRAAGRAPALQVAVTYQQRPAIELSLAGAEVCPMGNDPRTAKFELGFGFLERATTTDVEIEFRTELFEKASVERM